MGSSEKQEKPSLLGVAPAAAIASLFTKSLLHPIDTVKCRIQAVPFNTYSEFRSQWRGKWGVRQLYSGLGIRLLLYAPYQATYMTTYAAARERSESLMSPTKAVLCSAVCAELASTLFRVPMETIKVRMQASKYGTLRHAFSSVWRHGVVSMAKMTIPQTIIHDIPYSCVQWLCYEYCRGNSGGFWSFFSGGLAGAVAAFVCVPFDVIRTRVLVNAATDCTKASGVCSQVVHMVRREGWIVLIRGGEWRVLWVSSNMAVYFYCFEGLKKLFAQINQQHND